MRTSFVGVVLIALMLVSCSTKPKQKAEDVKTEKWSVRMANSIMTLSDSLLYYDYVISPERVFKLKWQYDVAMVGQVIDKLGSVDPKYSEYMKKYIDHFILEDGTVRAYKMTEFNIDRINPAKNLLTLYKRTGEEKYKKAILQFVEQMRQHPTTSEGGFWHKKSVSVSNLVRRNLYG